MWRQATFHPLELEKIGLPTLGNSRPNMVKDISPKQILKRMLSLLFLLMEGLVWDIAWRHEAFPNRFATHLHIGQIICSSREALFKFIVCYSSLYIDKSRDHHLSVLLCCALNM